LALCVVTLVLIVALASPQPARLGVVPADRDAVLGTYVVSWPGAVFICFGSVTRWGWLAMT